MFAELVPSLVLGGILLACAVGLMVWHLRVWRAARERKLDGIEYAYRRHQFRRRVQTTAMLGLTAVALPIGVMAMRWPRGGVFFWGGVLLLVVWLCLLALADVLASGQHYGRLRNQVALEEARLQGELYRLRGARRTDQANSEADQQREATGEEGSDSAG
jgi:hypothetical protein